MSADHEPAPSGPPRHAHLLVLVVLVIDLIAFGVVIQSFVGADPRFAAAERSRNGQACVAELQAAFDARPLADWRVALARQEGRWDAVQLVGELKDDPQVAANGYMQVVDYGEGRGPGVGTGGAQRAGARRVGL